jgi:hypothetical protein
MRVLGPVLALVLIAMALYQAKKAALCRAVEVNTAANALDATERTLGKLVDFEGLDEENISPAQQEKFKGWQEKFKDCLDTLDAISRGLKSELVSGGRFGKAADTSRRTEASMRREDGKLGVKRARPDEADDALMQGYKARFKGSAPEEAEELLVGEPEVAPVCDKAPGFDVLQKLGLDPGAKRWPAEDLVQLSLVA